MNRVALRMLLGDRAKYLGLIFATAFAAFLISHQASIFASLMVRTTSQIRDVLDADIWVMDPMTQYMDEVKPLSERDLYAVRAVPGVAWATPFWKGNARAAAPDGRYRQSILLGVDDATLTGAPRRMRLGRFEDLRAPDAIVIDDVGFRSLFPGAPLALGGTLELNERRAVIVGICDASPPFQTLPIIYARFSFASAVAGLERRLLPFVLARAEPGLPVEEVCARIAGACGLKALPWDRFADLTIGYYLRNTGIPVNFGITVTVALVVGAVVAGQTFYLFTLENLKQFASLKAIGVTDRRLVGMILLQALVVGLVGSALGIAGATFFFVATKDIPHLKGFIMRWPIFLGTGGLVVSIVLASSIASIRRVLVLEPAIVFRG